MPRVFPFMPLEGVVPCAARIADSNYHSTSNAMPAMLNMDHHYYALSHKHKTGEVRKTGRVISGGKKALVDLRRRNSYQVQYIHN